MDIVQVKILIFCITGLVNFMLAMLFWQKAKSKATWHVGFYLFLNFLYVISWAGLYYFEFYKLFWIRMTWLAPAMVSAYLVFSYYFTGRIRYIRLKILFWYGISFIILALALFTPYLIPVIGDKYPYIIDESFGPLNFWARLYTVIMVVLGTYYLIREYFKETGIKKWQLKYFLIGTILTYTTGVFFSGILLLLSRTFYIVNDLSALFSFIMAPFYFYAIFRRNIFEIKVLITQYLVSIIGIFLFIQVLLLPGTQSKVISFIVFGLYLIIGYMLIKSTQEEIQKEERARQLAEKLEDLNTGLEKKVDEKTKELRVKVAELSESQKKMSKLLEENNKSHEQMKFERDKTLAIIANFTDPVIVLDKENTINMINPAAKRIFGMSDSDLGEEVAMSDNFSIANFRAVIKKDFDIKRISEASLAENFISEEIIVKEEEKELVFKVITAKVLSENDEYLGAMKIFHDQTREKAIDKLKSEFITIAAHQLRTPLSAIKWAIKLVIDGDAGPINEEQKKLLSKGYFSNERVIVLINDMLDASQIEEGKYGYNFDIDDFREVLLNELEKVDDQVKSKNISLISSVPEKEMKIRMDKEKISLVIQNLLENAINYTPENGRIEVEANCGRKLLDFKIKDNGVGIPERDQEKLFSKFFRADNVIRIQTDGSGLGLFIVKNIVNQHGGNITYISEEGRGTEFMVTLPIGK